MGLMFESAIWDIVFVFTALAFGLTKYLTHCNDYWKRRGIAYIEPVLLFGNVKEFAMRRKSSGEIIRDMYMKYPDEPFVGFYQMVTPMLMIRDPELIQLTLKRDFGFFEDRGSGFDSKNDPLSANLVNLTGEDWRYLRHKLTPTFTSGKLKAMFHQVNECAREFVTFIEQKTETDLDAKYVVGKFTMDVIGECAFGIKSNALNDPNDEFTRYGREMVTPSTLNMVKTMLRFLMPNVAKWLRLKVVPDEMEKFYMRVVKENIASRKENNVIRNDFLQLMLHLRDKEMKNEVEDETNLISDEDRDDIYLNQLKDVQKVNCRNDGGKKVFTLECIMAQSFIFLTAGYETTSTTISYCLYNLAKNKECLRRVQEEVDNVLEIHGAFTYQAVKEMGFIEQCIDETLRMFSPATSLVRVCTKQYILPGSALQMNIGDKILIPVFGLHYDPQYFPDPYTFNPDRAELIEKKSSCYLPFGDGPRICIAARFAKLEMKVCIANLARSFSFDVSPKMPQPPQFDPASFLLMPLGGVWLTFHKR